MVGLLLGSLVGGAISDRYGKRPVLLLCVCVQAACGLIPAILPQPFVFLAVRCLTGICCCGINICSFSLGRSRSRTVGLSVIGARCDTKNSERLSANEDRRRPAGRRPLTPAEL